MDIPAELQIALVSAAIALPVGGAVVLFGAGPVLTTLARAARFTLRRRRLATLALGAAASGGLAAANAVGLEPVVTGDAVAWFQSQIDGWIASQG
ncbi:hypothetical protein [Hyphobacterium marinum]|uniref:Uncharacterized protein n=1 Tax=Hyphobacterium marinum TaxID=3116574 RepID=A0ABU7LVL1_9PROT|nr:hypothetical protein [Hyphobacterium sp. Y6023]MEE2565587.1 hypothetical protein [Hyphobacterium sp. Y6023]